MKLLRVHELSPEDLDINERLWAYNGMDTMGDLEILQVLEPQLTPTTAATYQFERDLLGPILEMNMRGVRIDLARRAETVAAFQALTERLSDQVSALIREGVGWDFPVAKGRKYSWPSPDQLKTLFFDIMGLPRQYKGRQQERRLSVDREALENLENYYYATPIIRHILALRDLQKRISFLETDIDADGRIRTSFNIAGTKTGRLASSYSDFGSGTNLQNVENALRAVFIADPGYKFCNIDLEQGDSRGCGAILYNLFGDGRYLDACESGDLHTTVARLCFDLDWTGDLGRDKALASSTPLYRSKSIRDGAKTLGHGTNYRGTPTTMAKHTHIPLSIIKSFRVRYLQEYPFESWWEWVEEKLRRDHQITTLLGRQRTFFGSPKDDATIREAVAYEPQSITADTIDRGLLALWQGRRDIQLLLQVHDSILFQYPEHLEEEVVPWALGRINQIVLLKDGRPFCIPGEAKCGWNWSDSPSDPDAMRKYNDSRRPKARTRGA